MAARIELLGSLDRLDAATIVLGRARLAHPTAGVWEAADVQWWWRRPRSTDELALPVWFDDAGPCGAVALTDWGATWQADALSVPDAVRIDEVWAGVIDAIERFEPTTVEVPVRQDDLELLTLLAASGFDDVETQPASELSGILWVDAESRPRPLPPPDGFVVTDRLGASDRPHHLCARNGGAVEARLQQCSLYDPELDLAVESPDGQVVGYALFWMDPVTGVGMLEPMRVEEAYQRQGLGRALLTAGLDRLAGKGARRMKVGCNSRAGRHLYESAGFAFVGPLLWFRRRG